MPNSHGPLYGLLLRFEIGHIHDTGDSPFFSKEETLGYICPPTRCMNQFIMMIVDQRYSTLEYSAQGCGLVDLHEWWVVVSSTSLRLRV